MHFRVKKISADEIEIEYETYLDKDKATEFFKIRRNNNLMKNITRKNQLYFDFGRDYDASLENFFFSSKNQVLKNELIETLIHSDQKKDIFISGTTQERPFY